jgi:hypothetical protein
MVRGCKKKKKQKQKKTKTKQKSATNGCEAAESKAFPLLNPLRSAAGRPSWWAVLAGKVCCANGDVEKSRRPLSAKKARPMGARLPKSKANPLSGRLNPLSGRLYPLWWVAKILCAVALAKSRPRKRGD